MIVYFSMFAYVYITGKLYNNEIDSTAIRPRIQRLLIWLIPIILIGLRTDYGDTAAYINEYNLFVGSFSRVVATDPLKGILWALYKWLLHFIFSRATPYILITTVIQACAVSNLYHDYSPDYSFSVLLFFLGSGFTNMMNGIREFMAVAIVLFGFHHLVKGNHILFIAYVLIASLFHFSAIIWLPAALVVDDQPFGKKVILASAAILIAIVFVDRFTVILDELLEETAYAGYADQFANDNGSNFVHTLISAVPALLAYLSKDEIKRINSRTANIFINISVMGMMTSLLANFTSGILIGRLPVFFTVFNFATLPWLFRYAFTIESNKKMLYNFCLLGYLLYAVYYWSNLSIPYISTILRINTMS